MVVVADSSKIERVAFARICDLSAVEELITDMAASPEAVRKLRDVGVRVVLV